MSEVTRVASPGQGQPSASRWIPCFLVPARAHVCLWEWGHTFIAFRLGSVSAPRGPDPSVAPRCRGQDGYLFPCLEGLTSSPCGSCDQGPDCGGSSSSGCSTPDDTSNSSSVVSWDWELGENPSLSSPGVTLTNRLAAWQLGERDCQQAGPRDRLQVRLGEERGCRKGYGQAGAPWSVPRLLGQYKPACIACMLGCSVQDQDGAGTASCSVHSKPSPIANPGKGAGDPGVARTRGRLEASLQHSH